MGNELMKPEDDSQRQGEVSIFSDLNGYRESLVNKYRGEGHKSVLRHVREGGSEVTSDEIFGDIIEEILEGSEQMLGTQLLMTEEGDLEKATVVTVKRSELLRSVAEIVAKRKELNQRASDIDLNSPAFMLYQKICFEKITQTLEELEIGEEMTSMIITGFAKKMETWGKELKQKLDEMAQ